MIQKPLFSAIIFCYEIIPLILTTKEYVVSILKYGRPNSQIGTKLKT